VFHPLGTAQIRAITEIQTLGLRKRLGERSIGLEFSEAALSRLAEAGYDPVYGARPLKRAIQTLVENPLARDLLDGKFAVGDTVKIDVKGGAIAFERKAA